MQPDTPTHRFQRHERLRRASDFRAVFNNGTWGVGDELRLIVSPNELDHNRYGFAVSKKFGNAVARNLTKRRMREAVRHLKHELPHGYDCILMPSKRTPKPRFDEIARALPKLFAKALRRRQRPRRKGAHG